MSDDRILVIGAGPTGIGAAWRLEEKGHTNWGLLEGAAGAGGLATSIVDDQGFTWDLGGHVLFSHYEYFDRMMEAALGEQWLEHEREAWVWMRDRWIPYPFQNNIWRLPEDELIACLEGLVAVNAGGETDEPRTFADWLLRSFGQGICDSFLYPYNFKVWAVPPDRMNVEWMAERVATVDLARVLRNLVLKRDDVGWGPNARFRFPLRGGTGAIWESLSAQLPQDRLHFSSEVVAVETGRRVVRLADGREESYDRLLSTIPLDRLLGMLSDAPDLARRADEFVYSSSHIIGIGLEGELPPVFATKCWMYFPEPSSPFYRLTVFSNYSPNNVPDASRQWSLMAEVSESSYKPVDEATVVQETIDALRSFGFIPDDSSVVSRWHRRLERGYPTPWIGRDAVLHDVQPALRDLGILSRGRFGGWKYEVANQDHSTMQGVEAVDWILEGKDETTYSAD